MKKKGIKKLYSLVFYNVRNGTKHHTWHVDYPSYLYTQRSQAAILTVDTETNKAYIYIFISDEMPITCHFLKYKIFKYKCKFM
jgi:hypothetical protein